MAKRTGPTNPYLRDLVAELKKKSIEQGVKIWKRIARDLEKPTRKRRVVNLYRINKYSKKNEIIIVPGKVLALGELDHPVTIAAWQFSDTAAAKINQTGKAIPITELIKESPRGKRIRIIG